MKVIIVTWKEDRSAYFVDTPNWDGGPVINLADAEAIISQRDALVEALKGLCSLAPQSVEYSEWPELEEAVEAGYKALAMSKVTK